MKNPNRVRISGRKFKIKFQKGSNMGDRSDSAGHIVCDYQKIWVDTGNNLNRQQEVLLHEITHAVDFFGSLKLSEDQVHGIANGLYAVFRDNPKIVKWVTR